MVQGGAIVNAARHTPGPWTYPGGTGNFVGGPDRLRIADLGGLERSPEERQANARLIAAAPDLLAACIQAESVLRVFRECSVLKAGAPDTEAKLRAAILKAEGGAK